MKLAIIATHPIQYYAPWFRLLAQEQDLQLKVFYLWDFGVTARRDPGFQCDILWDIPLLEGYFHEFVPNISPNPGTSHFRGLQNPTLPSLLKEWSPDALLLMGYAWESCARLFLTWNTSRCPLLLRGDSHRLVPSSGPAPLLKDFLVRVLFSRISAFLYCGSANHDYFAHRCVDESKLFFCPHGVDQERFRPDPEIKKAATEWKRSLGIPGDHRVLLFAGKFEPKKQPLDLLRAFQAFSPEKTTLLYVGSGVLEARLKESARGDNRVVFHPPENQSRMPLVYQAADVFILPSAGPGETWGLAVQEALACGIPVITSSHVGCAEDLVQPNINGLIFPALSASGLEEALRTALSPGILDSWQPGCLPALERYCYRQAVQGVKEALSHLQIRTRL